MSAKICSIEGCGKKHHGKGWCKTHYKRWKHRGGDPSETLTGWTKGPEGCSVKSCTAPHKSKGYCDTHYSRLKRNGTLALRAYLRTCTVSGCEREHSAKGYCTAHYRRWKATGSPQTLGTPRNRRKSQEQVEREAKRVGLRLVEKYINSATKQKYECLLDRCGWAGRKTPSSVAQKSGCPRCAGLERKSQRQVEMEALAHGFELMEQRRGRNTPARYRCTECRGLQNKRHGDILAGYGCILCSPQSRPQLELYEAVRSLSKSIRYNDRMMLDSGKELDIFCPVLLKAIEFDGPQHYDPNALYYSEDIIRRDREKDEECKEVGIDLLRIRYDEWLADPEACKQRAIEHFQPATRAAQ